MSIFLAIVAFAIAGGIANKFLENSFDVFLIGGAAAYAVFMLVDRQSEQVAEEKCLPGPLVKNVPLPHAFGLVQDVLGQFHMGNRFWLIQNKNLETRTISALFIFKEDFGQFKLDRQVFLTVRMDQHFQGRTQVDLQWELNSPLNQGKANEVVEKTTAAIQAALTAAELANPSAAMAN